MNHTFRTQWLTGKVILCRSIGEDNFIDETEYGDLAVVAKTELVALRQRVAQADRRAAGQRKSRADKAPVLRDEVKT